MKLSILLLFIFSASFSFAAPRKPVVKDSMGLFNKLQPEIREELKPAPKTAQANSERIWSLEKIAAKYNPEDPQKALLDLALESAPEKTTAKRRVFRVVRVAPGSIYAKAGVKIGDYVANQ